MDDCYAQAMIVEPHAKCAALSSSHVQPATAAASRRATVTTSSERSSFRISDRLSEVTLVRRWRKMTWVLIVVNALFLIWVISAVTSRPSKTCAPTDQLCVNASDTGTAIGVVVVIVLWVLVFIALSLVWLMSRPRDRADAAPGTTTPSSGRPSRP